MDQLVQFEHAGRTMQMRAFTVPRWSAVELTPGAVSGRQTMSESQLIGEARALLAMRYAARSRPGSSIRAAAQRIIHTVKVWGGVW